MFALQLLNSKKDIKEIQLSDELITIGRDPNKCEIVLSNLTVSKVHCSVQVISPKNIIIIDLGSGNGTFVNDVQLDVEEETRIKLGDKIRIGAELEYSLGQAIPETIVVPREPKEQKASSSSRPQIVASRTQIQVLPSRQSSSNNTPPPRAVSVSQPIPPPKSPAPKPSVDQNQLKVTYRNKSKNIPFTDTMTLKEFKEACGEEFDITVTSFVRDLDVKTKSRRPYLEFKTMSNYNFADGEKLEVNPKENELDEDDNKKNNNNNNNNSSKKDKKSKKKK